MTLTSATRAVALTLALLLAPGALWAVSPSKVTLNFMCPCGSCDEALSTCECPASDDYRGQIAALVGGGSSEEQIIQAFVDRFGPNVLVANAALEPRSSGSRFNPRILGYLLVLSGISLAAFMIGRHRRTAAAPVRRRSSPGSRSRGDGKRDAVRVSKGGRGSGRDLHEDLLDD